MELLDRADDEEAVRAGPAEERHVIAGPGDHLLAADELAAPVPDARAQSAGPERDDIAFGRLELAPEGVDPKHATPEARHALVAPASLAAAEQGVSGGGACRRADRERTRERDEDRDRSLRHRAKAATDRSAREWPDRLDATRGWTTALLGPPSPPRPPTAIIRGAAPVPTGGAPPDPRGD